MALIRQYNEALYSSSAVITHQYYEGQSSATQNTVTVYL